MKLLGLTGGMGTGKSTAIEYLKEMAVLKGLEVHNVKFAQPLYDIQEYVYRRISSVYTRPETFVKDRKLLQWIGTDWGRDTISETIWGDIWQEQVNAILKANPKAIIVCDDVRFDNEGERIKRLGGSLIKLTSDRAGARIDIKAGITGHKSEAGVDPKYIDFIINNDSTIDDFQESLFHGFDILNIL